MPVGRDVLIAPSPPNLRRDEDIAPCMEVIFIVQTQIEILVLMAVGYLISKIGLITPKARGDLTNLLLYVVLPCNIFHSFQKGVTVRTLVELGVIFLIAMGSQFLYIIVNHIAYRKTEPSRRLVMQYATISNNASFMGLPIVGSVFGDIGVLYGSVALIPLRIFMWTAGLSLFTQMETRKKVRTLATHPCILAVFLGIAYMLLPVQLPDVAVNTIEALGNCTTALSMIIVGSILSDIDIRTVLNRDCFYYSAIRLIAIPALIFGVLTLLRVDPVVRGVAVLSSAMPAATMTATLAYKYGQNSEFASKLLFISTVLSLVTLPLVSVFLK